MSIYTTTLPKTTPINPWPVFGITHGCLKLLQIIHSYAWTPCKPNHLTTLPISLSMLPHHLPTTVNSLFTSYSSSYMHAVHAFSPMTYPCPFCHVFFPHSSSHTLMHTTTLMHGSPNRSSSFKVSGFVASGFCLFYWQIFKQWKC